MKVDPPPELLYSASARFGIPSEYENEALGTFQSLGVENYYVYSFELDDLAPKEDYYFVVGNGNFGYSEEFKFRTLTDGPEPIYAINGGDMGTSDNITDLAKPYMKDEPDVILIGGDIAYANGDPDRFERWLEWFDHIYEVTITGKGYLVPMILAIGNHEVNDKRGSAREKAPFFFKLFPQHGNRSYFVRNLGSRSVVLVLDTGHTRSIFGKQRRWLKKKLRRYQDKNTLALYHVPMYPSVRNEFKAEILLMRLYWLRYFDRYNLNLAVEHHDHAYKRTKLLKDGRVVDEGGTMYIGDGAWGKEPRDVDDKFYIEHSESINHIWHLSIQPEQIGLKATNLKLESIDRFTLSTEDPQQIGSLIEPESPGF
jgi:hypothetical protein